MTRWRTHRYDLRSSRGAAAVEFAIVAVLLLAIIFAIIDFGRLFFVVQGVKSASREAARVAAVKSTNSSIFTTATNSAAAVKALSGTTTLSVKAEYCTATDVSTCTWVAPGSPIVGFAATTSTPANGTNPICASTVGTKVTAVRVTVTSSFKWITPVGNLPGFSNASLTGTRDVTGSTTMRCEG